MKSMQPVSGLERPIRILIIDDDEDDFLLVEDMLSEIPNLDFELEHYGDYAQGLEAVLSDRHDVYLIDYYLGPYFGLDIIRQARDKGIFSPMILLIGREDDEIDRLASTAGASDYLVKEQLSAPLLGRSIRCFGAGSATARGNIAVIDDEPLIGDIVKRALESEHDVAVFSSGMDMLSEVEDGHCYDVILCDLMMPGLTGMDMYEALMKKAPDQAQRMVFMTGGAFTPQAQQFVDEINNILIEKPFDLSGLKNLIREIVHGGAGVSTS